MKEMQKKNQINICGRIIGDNQTPLVIPEIGINHGGNFEKAKKMIKAASKSGAECVKFQCHIFDDEMISYNFTEASSLPVNPTKVTSMPKSDKFFATLAAPPGLSIDDETSNIGTGASGDILLTCPIQYLSSIMSPITSIFFCGIIYLSKITVNHSLCLS